MREPWHRQPGERRPQFDAFCHFRDMGRGVRTMDGAFRLHRTLCRKLPENPRAEAPGLWRQWAKQFGWVARADAHDAHIDDQTRAEKLEAIRAMNERHASIAAAMQAKLAERLLAIDASKLSPAVLAAWLDKASAVERRARGEPTEYVKQEHAGTVGVDLSEVLADLSDDERAVLRRILERRAGQSSAGA